MGCYVVRGVLTSERCDAWHQALEDSLTSIANEWGPRSIELRGGRTKDAFYNTIQCVDGECNCKYDYCATGKHKVWKVSEYKPFRAASDWLHQEHSIASPARFDEIVANIYSREKNECAGFHTDQSELLGETSNSVSVTLGAAGVFYWRPDPAGLLRGRGESRHRGLPGNRVLVIGGVPPCSQEI